MFKKIKKKVTEIQRKRKNKIRDWKEKAKLKNAN